MARRAAHAAALATCERLRRTGAACVVATIAAAYGGAGSPRLTFFAVLPLFAALSFAARDFAALHAAALACHAGSYGLPPPVVRRPWFTGLALAARHGWLALLLCFDAAWLAHAYVRPSPAPTFAAYVERLAVGPLGGASFLGFTALLWIALPALAIVGGVATRDASLFGPITGAAPRRIATSVAVTARGGATLRLNGYRLPRPGAQPVLLWPGFFQNGFIFDLLPGECSLAESLSRAGYDVWIFHPRGTESSGGRELRASLDDYAATDLPAIISFVRAHAGRRPILVGHSQGGITSILSLMGAIFDRGGEVALSDDAAAARQDALAGLVTLGAFPSFAADRERDLQRLVRAGLPLLGLRIPLPPLLAPLRRFFTFVGVPVDLTLRRALAESLTLRALLFPLFVVLDLAGRLRAWEFLYHLPNAPLRARRQLFFATIDGTFTDVLEHFRRTVLEQRCQSLDGAVDYSAAYARLRLPLSIVAMELDEFVEYERMVGELVGGASSAIKHHTYLPQLGHEDFFLSPGAFVHVHDAIRKLVAPEPRP